MKLRWRALFERGRLERELDSELDAHLAERSAQFEEQGMTAAEAQRRAKLRFGRRSAQKERTRESWGWEWLFALGRDFRYSARVLAKNRSFTLAVAVSLAIGLGASTAMFAVVYGVLLERLPFPEQERVVRAFTKMPESPGNLEAMAIPWGALDSIREGVPSAEELTAVTAWTWGVRGDSGWPERVAGARIDPFFFRVFPVRPAIGRLPDPAQFYTGDKDTILLSFDYWKGQYGGDEQVIGRTLTLEGTSRKEDRSYTVIGVLPEEFSLPSWRLKNVKFWVPDQDDWRADTGNMISKHCDVYLLLLPGTNTSTTRAELEGVYVNLLSKHRAMAAHEVVVEPVELSYADRERTPLLVLFGASLALMLLCCVNAGNLLLARGLQSRAEFAVRRSVGAGNGAIFRQLLAQAILLGGLGVAAGLTLSHSAIALFRWAIPPSIPFAERVGLQGEVTAFLVACAVVVVAVASVAPLTVSMRTTVLGPEARSGARISREIGKWLRGGLLAAQMGLSLLLFCGSLLLLENLNRALNQDYGFQWKDVTCVSLQFRTDDIDKASRAETYWQLGDRLGAAFGDGSWAVSDYPPVSSIFFGAPVQIQGGETQNTRTFIARNVSPGYFRFLGMPILHGRAFTVEDGPSAPEVAIASRQWARAYFGEGNPVGRQFRLSRRTDQPWITLIGVVDDVRTQTNFREELGTLYRPLSQQPQIFTTLLLRTAAPLERVTDAVREATIAAGLPKPVLKVFPLTQEVWRVLESARFFAVVLAVFAAVALLLAAIGVFGVLQFYGVQRRPEFGIRAAIGATRRNLEQLVVRQAALPLLFGAGAGLMVALWLSKYLESILHTVEPLEPLPYVVATGTLLLVAGIAAWLPARKAAVVDPAQCLRAE